MSYKDIMFQFRYNDDNGKRYARVIPINPNVIQINQSRTIDLVDMLDSGQVSILGATKLRTIEFSSIFPADTDIYREIIGLTYGQTPLDWIKFMEGMLDNKNPFDFLIVRNIRAEPPTYLSTQTKSIRMVVEDFKWRYRGGWGDDIDYDLILHEYRDTQIRTTTIEAIEEFPGGERPEEDKPEQFVCTTDKTDEELFRSLDVTWDEYSSSKILGLTPLSQRLDMEDTIYSFSVIDWEGLSPLEIEELAGLEMRRVLKGAEVEPILLTDISSWLPNVIDSFLRTFNRISGPRRKPYTPPSPSTTWRQSY